MGSLLVQRVNLYQMIGIKQQNDKFVFGGQGPRPMRFGSEADTVSTGRRSKRGWAGIGSVR